MGNSIGCVVKCQIMLEHEREGNTKLALIAGNQLKGRVLLWVDKELSLLPSVTLSLHGKEKSEVRNEQTTFDSAERTLISSAVTLRESNEEPVKAGKYTLPFSMDLPSSLPTSMKATEHSSSCKIKYKLTVLVGKEVLLKRLFTVASAELPNQVVQVTAEPKAHAIKGIRKQKGHLLMGAKVVNAQVGRSKNVEVFLACRNDASVDIERVQIRLLEKVRWSAQTYKMFGPKNEENIRWKNHTRVLAENADVEVPGLKKKKKTILPEDQSEAIYQIYDALLSGENKISVEVPYASRDTYHGQLIETSHLIEITLFTKALVENPTIEIPIKIGFPPRDTGLPPLAPVPADDRHEAFVTAIATVYSTELNHSGISISSLPDAETPVAEAIFFVEEEAETAQSPMVVAPPEAMVLGGRAILLVQDSERLLRDTETSELLADTGSIPVLPSLARLLEEMMASIYDYDIITDKLQDSEWSSLLAAITPDEFGNILAHVNVDFDQPEVASLLANCIKDGGGNFTCDYCVAAIHNSAECSRQSTVQELLPLCTNIKTCHAQITSELTEWEKVILKQDFEDLLGGTGTSTSTSLGPNSEGA